MGTGNARVTLVDATAAEAEGMLEASLLVYAQDRAASTDADVDRALAHGRELVGGAPGGLGQGPSTGCSVAA